MRPMGGQHGSNQPARLMNQTFRKAIISHVRTPPQTGDKRMWLGMGPDTDQDPANDPLAFGMDYWNGERWIETGYMKFRDDQNVTDLFVNGYIQAAQSVMSAPGLIYDERDVSTVFTTQQCQNIAIGDHAWVVCGATSGGASGVACRSLDHGSNWGTSLTLPFAAPGHLNCRWGDTGSTYGTFLMTDSGGKVARSTDNGATWGSAITTPFYTDGEIPYDCIHGIDPDTGDKVWLVVGGAVTDKGVVRSTDDGQTWSAWIDIGGSPKNAVSYNPDQGTFIIACHYKWIYRSTDMGLTWTQIEAGSGIMGGGVGYANYSIKYGDGVWMMGGGDFDLYRSLDDGETWTEVTSPFTGSKGVYGLEYGDGIWIAATEDGQVSRSTDAGLTWDASVYGTGTFHQPFGTDGHFNDVAYDHTGRKRFGACGWLVSTNAGFVATSDWLKIPETPAITPSAFLADLNTNTLYSSLTTIVCDEEIFDNNDDYDHTTGIFTAPRDGLYQFNFHGLTAYNASATTAYGRWYVNGAKLWGTNEHWYQPLQSSGADQYADFASSVTLELEAGDEVKVVVRGFYYEGYTYFSGIEVPFGYRGPAGADGLDGSDGADGAPGLASNWSDSTTYSDGDVVAYNNAIYESLQDSNLNKNPGTEPTWWAQITLANIQSVTPAAFAAYPTSHLSSIGAAVLNTEICDNGGDYDHTTGEFTAPRDGVYHFYFQGFQDATNTRSRANFQVNTGGGWTDYAGNASVAQVWDGSTTAGQYNQSSMHATMVLDAGDKVRVYVLEAGFYHTYTVFGGHEVPQGYRGPAGLAATWSGSDTYAEDDIVAYEDKIYKSLQNSNTNKNPSTETSWWKEVFLTNITISDSGPSGGNDGDIWLEY